MKTIEQPPPGPDHLEELPPEGWRGTSPGQFWGMMGVGAVMVLLVAAVAWPLMFRQRGHGSDRVQAINNAKQVGLALLEFDQEYGSFPNASTAAMVKKDTGTKLDLSGGSSNAMFRQLIAYGIQSEDIFFTRHAEGSRKPDRVLTPGFALKAREVGFSYVAGLDSWMNPAIPVMMTPMRTGTREFWMGRDFGDKAVILRLDNSVEAPVIRSSDRKVSVGNGLTLFDTGPDTVWGSGHWIDLRHPEF